MGVRAWVSCPKTPTEISMREKAFLRFVCSGACAQALSAFARMRMNRRSATYGNGTRRNCKVNKTPLRRSSLKRSPTGQSTLTRRHFSRCLSSLQKISEEKLNSAMEQYSRNVLLLSQRGLQNAYALHRLGGVLSNSDMTSIDLITRRRWTEMVGRHSEDLNSELRKSL